METQVRKQTWRTFRVAVLVIVVLFETPFIQTATAANVPLFYGSKDPGATMGPVLSNPEIIPIFYGDFSYDDSDAMLWYLYGFANYLSGAETPNPMAAPGSIDNVDNMMEPIMRQYGIWGASLPTLGTFSGANVPNNEVDDVAAIHNWQQQGLLPPDGPNRIFLLLMSGFSSYSWQNSQTCAKHSVSGNTYYALVSWDGCTGNNTSQFQRIVSHELEEAMTDPGMNNAAFGWVTHNSVLGLGQAEGADQCETNAGDPPIPLPGPLSFGTLQNFTDNSTVENYLMPPGDGSQPGAHCGTWSRSRAPHFSVTARGDNETKLDVIYQNFNDGGALEHAVFFVDRTWSNETIEPAPGTIVGAPVVVDMGYGRLDVVVRVIGNWGELGNGLAHWHTKSVFGGFTPVDMLTTPTGGSGIGPPTAVTLERGSGRLDVFTSDTDASLLHFWNDSGGSFSSENLGGFMIGPPTATSRGTNMIDVLSYSAFGGGLQQFSWNTAGNPNNWTVGSLNVTDLYFGYPADVISAAPWSRSGHSIDSLEVYVSGLLLSFGTTSLPWSRSVVESFGSDDSSNRGTVAIASDTSGSNVVAVWWHNPGGVYTAVHFSKGRQAGNALTIGNGIVFMGPPQVVYSSDGYPEVLGLAEDGCLRETYLDFNSGGPVVNGPFSTGICGLR